MKIITFIFIFFLISCETKREIETLNKYLIPNKIDSTDYYTFNELYKKGEIDKIKSLNCEDKVSSILAFENNFIFLEKISNLDKRKITYLKIDKNGNTIDSLTFSKDYLIINDYIINKNSYCSWFVNNDKNFKKLINIDFFNISDTIKVKEIVEKLKKNNIEFHSTSEYDINDKIDTCNYILSFKKNELVKYNYPTTIKPEQLKIENKINNGFTSKFKALNIIENENLYKYDNFFAYSYDKLIREGISGGDLFNNNGTQSSSSSYYKGTYFITLKNRSNLKLKLINSEIDENKEYYVYEDEKYLFNAGPTIYSETFLNFYIIPLDCNYYIIKK